MEHRNECTTMVDEDIQEELACRCTYEHLEEKDGYWSCNRRGDGGSEVGYDVSS